MRSRYIFYREIVWLGLFFASCTHPRAKARNNEIARITFASGGCNGKCPLLAIEVDSSLNYRFYGGLYSDKPGYFTGKINRELWDSINIKLEAVKFKNLDTAYQQSIDDLATQTVIFYGNGRKVITAQSASLPRSVDSVWRWIMYSYRKVNLTQSKDGTAFYARLQYPIQLPPRVSKRYKTHRITR